MAAITAVSDRAKQLQHIAYTSRNGGTPLSPDATLREVVQWIISDEDLRQSAVAKEVGVSTTVLNQWLNGRYPGDNKSVEEKVTKWLQARGERADAQALIPSAPAFVMTRSAEKILGALGYAQVAGDMAEIHGAPGVGKTHSAMHYRDTHPNVWMATMAPDSVGILPALEEIGEAVGVRAAEASGARRLARAIRDRISGTKGLLIIDEAQHVSVQALEEIRSLHDATKVGIALLGSSVLHSRFTGGLRATSMAQLYSRFGVRKFLRAPSKDDVAALLDAWHIEDDKAREFLAKVAGMPGALRGMTKCLLLAHANAAGAQLTLAHLQDAWRTLGE